MTILERLQNYINDDNNKYYGYEISSHDAKEIVKALQFQQSVVRCGDCIHQYKDERLNGLYCALMSTVNIKIIADNDEYCSAGERRDEE